MREITISGIDFTYNEENSYEKDGHNLTYKELYRFAKYYNQIDVPEKIIPKLIATNFVNPLLVASEFLPYFYSLGGNVSYKNNNINITKQEFLKTYELYKKIHFTSYNSMSEWWNEEIEAFNTGKTSAVICYTSQLANITISDIGFTSIPGSVPSLGGGCIGICKNTKKLNSSLIFLKWLYQYQIQLNFAKHGICVPYNNMYYNREVYKKYPFLAFSNSLHSNSKRTHYAGNGIKVNTISFENLLATEVLKGINNNLIGEKIYTNLIESLNKHQDTLIKK